MTKLMEKYGIKKGTDPVEAVKILEIKKTELKGALNVVEDINVKNSLTFEIQAVDKALSVLSWMAKKQAGAAVDEYESEIEEITIDGAATQVPDQEQNNNEPESQEQEEPDEWDIMFDRAVELDAAGDYKNAFPLWEELAKNGSVSSQFNVGLYYHNGRGVYKDSKSAVKWYEMAAENGDAASMNWLGLMLLTGDGIPVDYDRARSLFEQAIEYDEMYAYDNLADMYYEGVGVDKDLNKAFELYLKAANLGHVGSMLHVGEMYWTGMVKPEDGQEVKDATREWYLKAANAGNSEAMLELSNIDGEIHSTIMEDGTLNTTWANPEMKRTWLKRAAELDNVNALWELAVDWDTDNARDYLERAVALGHADSMGELGMLYGNSNDYGKAFYYLDLAYRNGSYRRLGKLMDCYATGQGTAKNIAKFVELVEFAAKNKDAAQYLNMPFAIGDAILMDSLEPAVLIRACEAYEYVEEEKKKGGNWSYPRLSLQQYNVLCAAADSGDEDAMYFLYMNSHCHFLFYGVDGSSLDLAGKKYGNKLIQLGYLDVLFSSGTQLYNSSRLKRKDGIAIMQRAVDLGYEMNDMQRSTWASIISR